MRWLGVWGVWGAILGCSGPSSLMPVEALLVWHLEKDSCRIEQVVPGQPAPRVLAQLPGTCPSRMVFSRDGSRVLISRFPQLYEVVRGELHELPKLEVDTHPALPDPRLHFDGQGGVWCEVTLGEREPMYDSEGWPMWPAHRRQLYALRAGSWKMEAELVEPENEPPATYQAFVARFSSEVALPRSLSRFEGQKAGAELRKVLDEVAGIRPDEWRVEGNVAQPMTNYSSGWPVLLRVGERWQALPRGEQDWSNLELGLQAVIVGDEGKIARAYSRSTGEQIWSGPNTASFWPHEIPISAP